MIGVLVLTPKFQYFIRMEIYMKKKSIYSNWMMLPAFLIFAVFFIIPNIGGFVLAFTDWNVYFMDDIRFIGFDNFKRLFTQEIFWVSLRNTLYFAIVTVIMKNIIGFALALLVSKASKFNVYLRTVMFMPVMISGIVISIIFVSIYNPNTGLLNSFLRSIGLDFLAKGWLVDAKYAMTAIAAMEIWQWSGFNMVICIAGIQSIPADYFEAASIDGATWFQKLRFITIPLMIQSFTMTFVFSIIAGFKVFAQVYGTTNGGPADSTQVMATFLFRSFSHGEYGYSAAVGLIFMIVITLFSALFLIYLRKKEIEY